MMKFRAYQPRCCTLSTVRLKDSDICVNQFLFLLAVIPVAAATMTPIPLLIGLCVKKAKERFYPSENLSDDQRMNGIVKGTAVDGKFNNNPRTDTECSNDFQESESTQKLVFSSESPNHEVPISTHS